MSKKEYLANRQNSGLLKSIFIEERARQLVELGNYMKEKKLNNLILT